jgi:hypothetical protein
VIRYISIFVVLLLPVSLGWTAEFDEVRQLISEGSYTQALQELDTLEKSISGEPNRAKLKFIQAQALTLSGEVGEAIDIYKTLAEKFPANPEPYLNLSALYVDQGDLELARDWAIRGLRSEDNFKKLYDNLAAIHGVLAANAYRVALNDPSIVSASALAISSEITIGEPSVIEVVASEAQIEKNFLAKAETQAKAEAQAKVEALSESAEYVEIRAFVMSWAEDWANQNVEEYISNYTETYAPAGLTHAEWLEQRQGRLTNKGFIKVAVEQINITNVGDVWQAEFWQTYESDSIEDTIKKRLSLERMRDSWLISAEEVL